MRASWLALLLAGCAVPPVAPVLPSPPVAATAAPRLPPSNPQQTSGLQLVDPASPLSRGLRVMLDRTLTQDARSWLFNRYDAGSVTPQIAVKKDDAKHAVFVVGGYTVNQGHRMLAMLAFQNGRIACIATSDFPGICRPVGQPPSHQIARALAQGNGQPNTGAAPAGEAFGGCDAAGSRNSMAVALDDGCGLSDVMESVRAEERKNETENRDAAQEGQDMPHPDSEVAPED